MGRPLSGKSAPKGNRPSLIERFGGTVESPKPTGQTVSSSPQMSKVAPSKPATPTIQVKKPIQTSDQQRASKRLDTPEAIAKRNAIIKANKEKMNKPTK
jgi:hypothetical protein